MRQPQIKLKRSTFELWNDFQRSTLLGVHLDDEHSRIMQFCFFSGIREFLAECDRIGKAGGIETAIGAYITRCISETEEYHFKVRPRMRGRQ